MRVFSCWVFIYFGRWNCVKRSLWMISVFDVRKSDKCLWRDTRVIWCLQLNPVATTDPLMPNSQWEAWLRSFFSISRLYIFRCHTLIKASGKPQWAINESWVSSSKITLKWHADTHQVWVLVISEQCLINTATCRSNSWSSCQSSGDWNCSYY